MAENWSSILKCLEQGGLVELLSGFSSNGVQIFGCICGAVPNKDVSVFLSMLKLSSVCDGIMPFLFSENVSKSGVLIFCRFQIFFGYDMIGISFNLIFFADLINHSRCCPF